MTIENEQGQEIPQGGDASQNQQIPPSDQIGISRAEYQELLTAAAVGQQLAAQMQAQSQQRPQQSHQPQISEQDIDRLSNSQLIQLMQQEAMAPVMQQVVNMQVKLEVAECRAEFDDFNDFQNETIRIASDNTSLSLREAYLLAKAHKGATPPKTNQATKDAPKVPTQTNTPPPSLKPGPAPSTAQTTGTLSTRDAAAAALAELKYE